jgi:plastocyanin
MAKKKRRTQTTRPSAAPQGQPELSAEERAARREEQKREWAQQKQAEERATSRSFTPILLAGGVVVTLAIVIPVVLLLAGGGGGSSSPTPTVRPDPRLGGQAPVATFAMSADDDGQNINPRFVPNNFVAKAGQVFEIDVTNDGTVFHNVTIDGGDGEYGTADDWLSVPLSFAAGEKAKVLAKFDQPGTYKFECNLHAGIQIGTITVIPGASGTATAEPSATPAPSQSVSP